jgi:hypothetical protein
MEMVAKLGLCAADERAKTVQPVQALAALLEVPNDVAVLHDLRSPHKWVHDQCSIVDEPGSTAPILICVLWPPA